MQANNLGAPKKLGTRKFLSSNGPNNLEREKISVPKSAGINKHMDSHNDPKSSP